MKIRTYPESNYKAIFFNGKTIRQKINDDLPFKVTKTPEIEDVAINSKCFAQCSYCYTSATKKGTNFENIIQKAKDCSDLLLKVPSKVSSWVYISPKHDLDLINFLENWSS